MPKCPQDHRRTMERGEWMFQPAKAMGLLVVSAAFLATLESSRDATNTWRDLVIAPEHGCSPYDRKRDYP